MRERSPGAILAPRARAPQSKPAPRGCDAGDSRTHRMTRVTLYPAAVPRLPRLSSLFSRRPAPDSSASGPVGTSSDARRATLEHLQEFVRTRVGVEAYVEP